MEVLDNFGRKLFCFQFIGESELLIPFSFISPGSNWTKRDLPDKCNAERAVRWKKYIDCSCGTLGGLGRFQLFHNLFEGFVFKPT